MIIQKIKKTLKAYYDFLYISNEQHEKLEVLLRSQKNANYLESIDELLNFIDFSYTWSAKHKEGIVFDERLILICNLPMGGLDVLATVKAISEVRKNIIVVTRSNILPLIEQTGITVVAWDSVNIESNWEKNRQDVFG